MVSVLAKRILLHVIASTVEAVERKNGWWILLYHDVDKRFAKPFADVVDWARELFRVCSLSDGIAALDKKSSQKPLLTFTFDDADITTYEVVMPILSDRRIPGCVFAVPAYIRRGRFSVRGKVLKAMGWTQLREWLSCGHEVGSHTYSHVPLTYCRTERTDQEVRWAKIALEDGLGASVDHFAYPYGMFDRRTENALWQSGVYSSLATCLRGRMVGSWPRYRLRRNQVHPAFGPSEVMLRLRAATRCPWLWQLLPKRRYRPKRPVGGQYDLLIEPLHNSHPIIEVPGS